MITNINSKFLLFISAFLILSGCLLNPQATIAKTEPLCYIFFSSCEDLNLVVADDFISPSSSKADCEKFCKDYETFANQYVAFIKKYNNNPGAPGMMEDYTKLLNKATEWSQSKNYMACSSDPKVSARILKAAEKIANAL